ncbi:MAG TPA: acyl-CoA dehydrogenase family protein, partial [Acidimicrobiales bacterium]
MSIGIRDEHEELRSSLQRWVDARCPPEVTRTALDAESDALPSFWADLGDQGTLGIHLDEALGGQGAGLVELAVTAEVLGRAAAPGPWGTTAVVAAVVAESGDPTLAKAVVPQLVDGSTPATLVVPTATPDGRTVCAPGLIGRPAPGGGLVVSGSVSPLLNGSSATAVLAPVAVDAASDGGLGDGAAPVRWVLIELGPGVEVESLSSFDPSRRSARWVLAEVTVAPDRVLGRATATRIRDLALVVFAAEAAGGARWCLDTAAEHARTRQQFGRPIGQFQGVKHRLADMLVSVEQAVAAVWDAASVLDHEGAPDDVAATTGDGSDRLAVPLAAALALDGYVEAAKGAIQLLGGMGFTWEHDAHVHLRRSTTLRQIIGGTAPLRAEAARLALEGSRRRLSIELPPEAERLRQELAPLVASIAALADPAEQRRALADEGLLTPHWPSPFGRDA